ncbi:MAG: hypothetical protein AB8I08_38120 [Sandaracinaceae bacterium]
MAERQAFRGSFRFRTAESFEGACQRVEATPGTLVDYGRGCWLEMQRPRIQVSAHAPFSVYDDTLALLWDIAAFAGSGEVEVQLFQGTSLAQEDYVTVEGSSR